MSVRLTTPLILPDKCPPVMDDADTAVATALVPARCAGAGELTGVGPVIIEGMGEIGEGGTMTDGTSAGVEGAEDDGDGASTTHIRWERVATSFATVWASVLKEST